MFSPPPTAARINPETNNVELEDHHVGDLALAGARGHGVLILMIRLYQVTLSPLLGPACRFEPTCSRYMVESLRKYGVVKGLSRGLRRVFAATRGIRVGTTRPKSGEGGIRTLGTGKGTRHFPW